VRGPVELKRLSIALALVLAVALSGTATVVTLVAGQHFDAGSIYCNAEDGVVSIKICAASGWGLTETHVYVGAKAPTKSAPGRFPYSHENLDGASMDTFEIALDGLDIECGGTLYVAVHAVVKGAGLGVETAWGDGQYIRAGKNWAMYFTTPVFCGAPK
jgi:hypothetical protein